MRLSDITDYFKLKRWIENPLEALRFRKKQKPGDRLKLKFLSGHSINVRAGADYSHFRTVFLVDEYRLNQLPEQLNTVVDLGGNVGMFALRASYQAERVLTFEPVADNFAQLSENISSFDNIKGFNYAVANDTDTVKIYEPENPRHVGRYSRYRDSDGGMSDQYIEVPAISLDKIFADNQIEQCDLMKIDTEGSEYNILYGASEETLAKIKRIHGEYHHVAHGSEETLIENLAAYLEKHGFKVEICPEKGSVNFGLFYATKV